MGTPYTLSKPPRYSLTIYRLPNTQLNNHTLSVYTFSITTQYSTVTSFTEKQSQDQQNTCSSSSIIKCAMPWDAMSNIVMHVFPNDTHPLSLSPGPMGDISVHALVAAHDTTLNNSNYRGAWYVSRNIIPSRRAIRPSKIVHPLTTTMSQIQCKWHAQMKRRR